MKHPLYSEAEKATITTLYPTHSPAYVAKVIGRSVQAVKNFAVRNGLTEKRETPTVSYNPLTPEQLEQLAAVWTTQSRTASMAQFGVSKSAIGRYATLPKLGRAGSQKPKKEKPPKPAAPKLPPIERPAKALAAPKPDYRIGQKIPCGKKRVSHRSESQPAKKWYHYPMNSPEYNAGVAALHQGKQRVDIIDDYGRVATVYRPLSTTTIR